ncbi:MAG: GNAT family N-acetyltransferase [Candidatus Babeliales bacterium]
MNGRFFRIKTITFIVALLVGGGLGYYYCNYYSPCSKSSGMAQANVSYAIEPYNANKDYQDIRELFEENWYWLTTRPYTPKGAEEYITHMLVHKAPNDIEVRYFGKLNVSVLREEGKFVGFVAYYPENFHDGRVLYLAVKSEFRGKRYGQRLLMYAIDQLFKAGSKRVWLATRINNRRAQSLYQRAGMKEYSREDDFLFFDIKQKV